jgi:hypothetical protein
MKIKNSMRAAIVVSCLILSMSESAATGQAPDKRVIIPRGKELRLEMASDIDTLKNKAGDEFTCLVLEPPEYANALVDGQIISISNSRKNNGSEITLAFKTITLSDGRTGNLKGRIVKVFHPAPADQDQQVARSLRKRDSLRLRGRLSSEASANMVSGAVAQGRNTPRSKELNSRILIKPPSKPAPGDSPPPVGIAKFPPKPPPSPSDQRAASGPAGTARRPRIWLSTVNEKGPSVELASGTVLIVRALK